MSIEIVFFDAGETLVHPHPSFPELFAQIITEAGHPIDADDVAMVQQRLAPHLVDLAEDTGVDRALARRRGLEEVLDVSLPASVGGTRYRARRFAGESPLLEVLGRVFVRVVRGCRAGLKAVAEAGYRIGLISNFEGWLDEMLVELEVGDVFEVKIISGLVGIEKPDPAIYELALQSAGVDAAVAAHVGDSPGLDVSRPRVSVSVPSSSIGSIGIPTTSARAFASLEELAEVLPQTMSVDPFSSALDLAAAIKAKEISPVEVVQLYLDRIEKHDGGDELVRDGCGRARTGPPPRPRTRLRAVTSLPPVPRRTHRHSRILIETRVIKTTFSSRSYADYVPDLDAHVVSRIKDAGFIVIGKTNTSEFGTSPITESDLNGDCRNPWDTKFTPGGSSGGSAAAVAAGLVPLAQGWTAEGRCGLLPLVVMSLG